MSVGAAGGGGCSEICHPSLGPGSYYFCSLHILTRLGGQICMNTKQQRMAEKGLLDVTKEVPLESGAFLTKFQRIQNSELIHAHYTLLICSKIK